VDLLESFKVLSVKQLMSKIELFIQTHQKSRGKALAVSRDMNGHRAFKEVIVELKKHFEEAKDASVSGIVTI
jgi:predicted translin family RNA/ssDNA-binding protein